MEVNRVEDRGGKHKGKGGGKKGYSKTFEAFSAMRAGKGFRFGSDKEEEKVKVVEKARKGEKARKAKTCKGKRLGRTVCRFCHQEGHWGNECPNRHSVRNVEAVDHNHGGEGYVHNPPTIHQTRNNIPD